MRSPPTQLPFYLMSAALKMWYNVHHKGKGMKLSKKNKSRLQRIHKMLTSGKTLGGLLVSFAATAIGCGCHRNHGPHNVMGSYPNDTPPTNVRNEKKDGQPMGKYLIEPSTPQEELPPTSPSKPKPAQ